MFIDRCFPIENMDLLDGYRYGVFFRYLPVSKEGSRVKRLRVREDAPSLPALDMVDRGNAIVVAVDLPGIKKEDIVITVEKNTLKLTAERKSSKDEYKDEDFYHMERNRSKIESAPWRCP